MFVRADKSYGGVKIIEASLILPTALLAIILLIRINHLFC